MERPNALESAARLMGRDQTHCWHPYSQDHAVSSLPAVEASGAELTLGDGSIVIDAISSWWVNLHGHGHPRLIDAIARQAALLDHVSFADLTHQPAVCLAERLAFMLPGALTRIFFSDNGSTAVETALKIVIQASHHEGSARARRKIVAFRGGYHGETVGAMSLSCEQLFTRPFLSYLFDVERIDPPKPGYEEESLSQMKRLLSRGGICAFIFEPLVQGACGMVSHSRAALGELLRLCREASVITIADEVMTGFGRLGPLFASEELSQTPDIICLAKGLTGGVLPLGATACSEELYERVYKDGAPFLHGHSYCANPLACAAALASLELLEDLACFEQRQRISACHEQAARRLRKAECFRRVEVFGTLLVVEYETDAQRGYTNPLRDQLASFFLDQGVLLRPLGNTIYVLPPYCVTKAQLEVIYDAIERSINQFAPTLSSHCSVAGRGH